jgi:putative hydrolase of the HAD superfamily
MHIIFDLGNVVLKDDWGRNNQEVMKVFTKKYNITLDDMKEPWFTVYDDFYTGKITEDKFWTVFLSQSGVEKFDLDEAKSFYKQNQGPNGQMLEYVKELSKNHKISILSNIPKEWVDYKIATFGLDKIFNPIIASGYVGCKKPDKEIFEIALKKLNSKAKDCVFIDDREKNIVTAKQLGMKTILFVSKEELEEELENVLNSD